MQEKNPVQSAQRVFDLLELLAEAGTLGLTELSLRLGLTKSTIHRLLNSLIFMGYVKQDTATKQYSLTFKIVELSNSVLGHIDIISQIHNPAKRIANQSGETVHLVQREGNNIVYIDKVESERNSMRLVSRVGKSLPMCCTAVGKAIMAGLPLEEVKNIWDTTEIIKRTPNTITEYPVLLKELEEVRRKDYAIDNEENEVGVKCVACCLNHKGGRARYAISISAPLIRVDDARIEYFASLLSEVKQEVGM